MKITDVAQCIQYENVDDKYIERMLIRQAVCLETMFLATANVAMDNSKTETIVAATKLQEASRKTILVVYEIRHPKKSATFVKQFVNNNQLNQLVTEPDKQPSQLGETNASPVDYRSEIETVTIDSSVAPLAPKHRSQNTRRKGSKQ